MVDVLFINSTDRYALKYEANGTMLLATLLLQSGIQAKILRFAQFEKFNENYYGFIKSITEEIIRISPKCISFCAFWPHYHIMLRIAREVKALNPNITVVFGGPQASLTAKATMDAIDYIDYICTGEGENTVVPFFTSVLNNDFEGTRSVPGLYYRNNGSVCFNSDKMPLCDLNTLPYWDDSLWSSDYKESPKKLASPTYYMPIDAGRGCPYNCTFCCSSHYWRRTYRLKSAERILADIKYYKNKFGIRSFWFSHDAFTINKKLVHEICDSIIEEGLDIVWRCSARIDCIDEELILKMKKAGLRDIEFGIETGSEKMQKSIHKNLNLDKAKEMLSFILRNDIRVDLFFMYGFPDETEEDLNKTVEMIFDCLDMGISSLSTAFCKFNPATAITEKHFDDLILDPNISIVYRGLSMGYNEEFQVIKHNKALFPFFYHLDTPVRKEFQFLEYFIYIYRQCHAASKHLRSLYRGDNLKFYRDFYNSNKAIFQKDISQIQDFIREDPLAMMHNMVEHIKSPYTNRLKALLKFDSNMQKISKSKEDISIKETYDFSYIDFKLKLPIEKYSEGKTEILLYKKNDKTDMKVINII